MRRGKAGQKTINIKDILKFLKDIQDCRSSLKYKYIQIEVV